MCAKKLVPLGSSIEARPEPPGITPPAAPLEVMTEQFDYLVAGRLSGRLTMSEIWRLERIWEILAEPFGGQGEKQARLQNA